MQCAKINYFLNLKDSSVFFLRHLSVQNFPSTEKSSHSIVSSNPLTERQVRLEKIGKSLEIYLNGVRAYEKRMVKEDAAFEIGKRHLANIMGWQANEILSQDKIDKAIEYLFPTGLHDNLAQPVLKPPREILPQMPKLEFDKEYRPKGHLFYTINGKFYSLLSKINFYTQQMTIRYDEEIIRGNISEENSRNCSSEICLPGSSWITREELIKKIDGHVTEDMYTNFIMALDYMVSLPMAYQLKDFIQEFRSSPSTNINPEGAKKIFGCEVPKIIVSKEGDLVYAISNGRVKKTIVEVKVSKPGNGKCIYNENHYSEFRSHLQRELIMAPLLLTDLFGKVDIDAKFISGNYGETVVPRAIRHGTSLCIAALFPEYREILRLAGLLTLDIRKKERSKINQPGARAKWIWKKR